MQGISGIPCFFTVILLRLWVWRSIPMVGHWDDFVPLSLLQLIHLNFRLIKEFYVMYRKGHFIPIFACSVIATLILGAFAPAFSENGDEFTLQLLHAADMEGDIEALENAPRFSSILNALRAKSDDTVIIGAGDSYIPDHFSQRAMTEAFATFWDVRGRDVRIFCYSMRWDLWHQHSATTNLTRHCHTRRVDSERW